MRISILKVNVLILPFIFYWAYWQTENLQCWKQTLITTKLHKKSKLKITAAFTKIWEVSNFKIQRCLTCNTFIMFHKDICLSGNTDFLLVHIFTWQGIDSSLSVNPMRTLNLSELSFLSFLQKLRKLIVSLGAKSLGIL